MLSEREHLDGGRMDEFAGNDELLARVEATTLDLPGSRKSIADFLVQEGSGVENLSMAEVADLTFTSKPRWSVFPRQWDFRVGVNFASSS